MEQITSHFEDVANITVNISSVITKEKQNGIREDLQLNTYNINEVNNSIEEITSKKIEQNAINNIEHISSETNVNACNQIDQIAREQK